MNTISINYKTAPLEIRRIFAFDSEEQKRFIKKAVLREEISECVMLCTCNRMEVYFVGEGNCVEVVQQMICEEKDVKLSKVIKYFNVYCGENSVRHLFKVAAGIDSMVLGEDEILGQVKEAYAIGLECKTTSFVTNTVFKMAITGAKKSKTLTGISSTPVSIATLTANMVFSLEKKEKQVLILGASGKTGMSVGKNLLSKPDINVIGTIRGHNSDNDLDMKYKNMRYISYMDRYKYMDWADVIISATTSPHFTVTAEEFFKNIKTDKERLFIDLAVPNDIDKEVGKFKNTKLFNIDYFKEIAKENNRQKLKEAQSAKEVLDRCCDDALKELVFHEFLPKLPLVKDYFNEKGIENIIYSLRKSESKEVLGSFLSILEKIVEV